MSVYMLNLMFDVSDASESNDGRFIEYESSQSGLQQSKVWFQWNGTTPLDPDSASQWTLLEGDSDLLTLNLNDQVIIRACPTTALTGYTARLTIIIARDKSRATHQANGKAFQKVASPFALSGTQQACTIFDTINPPMQAPNGNGSWYSQTPPVTLKTTKPGNAPPNFHDSYSVIVAFTLAGGGSTVTYSHDPDMDVNC